MAHFDAVLPGRVHRVIYERMVDDTETEVRALLDYCGLEFEPSLPRVLQDRARRPHRELGAGAPADLSRRDRGMAALRAVLGPLKEALGPVLDAYPEAPASFVQR